MFTKVVRPSSAKKQNALRSQHGVVSSTTQSIPNSNPKKLWRLPHVFANVLELPFYSDADVSIEDNPQFLRFVASCNNNIRISNASGVRAHAIEILPGMTKVVIRGTDGSDLTVTGRPHQQQLRFGIDLWRFRLPAWTRPEMATAVCSGGKLVVTVPKSRED